MAACLVYLLSLIPCLVYIEFNAQGVASIVAARSSAFPLPFLQFLQTNDARIDTHKHWHLSEWQPQSLKPLIDLAHLFHSLQLRRMLSVRGLNA